MNYQKIIEELEAEKKRLEDDIQAVGARISTMPVSHGTLNGLSIAIQIVREHAGGEDSQYQKTMLPIINKPTQEG